tara:strand:- start:2359 stop:4134 length:1776 start_codon:yes stop_codon:yes gene_type:complete
MVDRTLRHCPLCGRQNSVFIYRTDVGSGITTATCTSCQGVIRVNPPESPPLSPFSSPGFNNSSPMSQVRRLRVNSPRPQAVLFGNYSPPSSPPLPRQEGKVETQQIESKNDPAYELTQEFVNSQSSIPSEPSSPERGDSSGERAIRRGPPRRMRRLRVPVRRTNQSQRQRAVRAMMGFLGRRDVQETPRERAQRLADEDLELRSQAGRALERLNQMTGDEYAALNSEYRDSSEDEESDDEDMEEDEQTRINRIIKDRKRLHRAKKRPNASKGNVIFELKKTINNAIKSDINRPQPMAKDLMKQPKQQKKKLSSTRSKSVTEPRELFHPIMIDMDLIESLQDNDEIIFQLDKPPYNGYSIPKSFLRKFLTTHEYLQHTKYQCMGTGQHALMITENNIVFEHNHRGHFQFINASGMGIPLGLFLRQQLLNALNAKEKYFLIHIHEDTDINPIVSADEVQWYAPPVLNSTNTHFSVEGENISDWGDLPDIPASQFIVRDGSNFRGYDETHTQLTTNVSADHCQPSNGSKRHLLTIRPVNTDILRFIEHRTNTGSTKRKRRGGKRKTKKKKRKRNKRKKSRRRRRKTKKKTRKKK